MFDIPAQYLYNGKKHSVGEDGMKVLIPLNVERGGGKSEKAR